MRVDDFTLLLDREPGGRCQVRVLQFAGRPGDLDPVAGFEARPRRGRPPSTLTTVALQGRTRGEE